jgi:hypothetical protein
MSALTDQCLQSEADRIGVAPRAADGPRLPEEAVIDVERFLHAILFCHHRMAILKP